MIILSIPITKIASATVQIIQAATELNRKVIFFIEDKPAMKGIKGLIAIRPFIPFIAGLSSMKNITFLFSSVAACIIWTVALAILVIGIDNIINLFN